MSAILRLSTGSTVRGFPGAPERDEKRQRVEQRHDQATVVANEIGRPGSHMSMMSPARPKRATRA